MFLPVTGDNHNTGIGMESAEEKKKLNEDLVRFVRKRSDADVPRYTARLKTYVDIQQKRQRATAAREHEKIRRKQQNFSLSKDVAKPDGSGSMKDMRRRGMSPGSGSDDMMDASRRRRGRCRSRSRRRRRGRRSRCRGRRRSRRSRCRRRRGRRSRCRGRRRGRSHRGRRHRGRSGRRSRCGRRRRRSSSRRCRRRRMRF